MKPTAVRPLLNTSQSSIPQVGNTATVKTNILTSSTPSKTIPMTSSHSSPISNTSTTTINHVSSTNAGNFATVAAASHNNSQVLHTITTKVSCKIINILLSFLLIINLKRITPCHFFLSFIHLLEKINRLIYIILSMFLIDFIFYFFYLLSSPQW